MPNVDEAKISVITYLSKDPETRESKNGKTYVNFNFPCSVGWGDNKKTLWASGTWWGDYAAKRSKVFSKGFRVLVEGTLGVPFVNNEGVASLNVNISDVQVVQFPKNYEGTGDVAPGEAVSDVEDESVIPF